MNDILTVLTKNLTTISYILIVLLIFFVIAFYAFKMLLRLRDIRRRRLKNRKTLSAIKSKGPHDDTHETAKKIGFASIDKQFSITKKILIPFIILPLTILLILPFLSKLPASFLTFFIGISTVVGSMAARPFIENVISGLVLSFSKVLNIGDIVAIDSLYGTIEDITLFHTIVKGWDWRRYIVPNIQMLEHTFYNHTLHDSFQWASVDFFVSYDNDIQTIRQIAIACARKSIHFAEHERPKLWIIEMHKDSVKCRLAAWADSATNAWYLKSDIQIELMKEFRKQNIEIHSNRQHVTHEPSTT